jgi:hypothetical protein
MKVDGTTWIEVGDVNLIDARVCVELVGRNEVRLAVFGRDDWVEVSSSYVTRARALALAAMLCLAALTPWCCRLRFWWLRSGRGLVTRYAERCRKWLALLIGPERKRGSFLSTAKTPALSASGSVVCGHGRDTPCKSHVFPSEPADLEHGGRRLYEVERG